MAEYRFDRTVSDVLLAELVSGGRFHGLVEYRNANRDEIDAQLRADQRLAGQRGRRSWVSLYLGLTSVLDIDERNGEFRLRAHATHRARGGFVDTWQTWQSVDQLAAAWPHVTGYLDAILGDGGVDRRHVQREGLVHAAIASGRSPAYGVVQREATIWFTSTDAERALVEPWREEIWTAMTEAGRVDAWWPTIRDHGTRPRMGLEADFVAIDGAGRLVTLEAKPANETKGLAWGPAQVRLYAQLVAALLDDNPDAAGVFARMAAQRAALGLLNDHWQLPESQADIRVVPVLAIGSGARSPRAFDRITAIATALDQRHHGSARIDPLEVWVLDPTGDPELVWRPGLDPVPAGSSTRPPRDTFSAVAMNANLEWKRATATVADEHRADGVYDGRTRNICLPASARNLNLLPEARDIALARFSAAGVRWHGDTDGPSNHLLSSQIQCLNALAPFVHRPEALRWLFAPVLPIDTVLPFGSPFGSEYDTSDHVVFEWTGLADHLGEWRGATPTRGAYVTSPDAAIRYRTPDGRVEVALIEWKYTEQYPHGALAGGPAKQANRRRIYRAGYDASDGPIRHDVINYDDLFYEPIYQLFRQALLANAMERTHELDADTVRVVYVAPFANHELWQSLPTPRWRELAGDFTAGLLTAWWSVLRQPDRFAYIDSARFVAADAPTSMEFKTRYGHLGTGVDQSMTSEQFAPDAARVASALQHLEMILRRISGEGSVLESTLHAGADRIARLDPALRAELVNRADELAELARYFRAEPLNRADLFCDP